ncbi:MAG: EthD domain-containing protein [Candidatus Binatia bacterium]
MVKVITLVKRKDGLTQEEFSRYWEEKHGPLIAKVFPGVRRYVQNHAARLPGGGAPQVDGVVELWFDDLEAWRAAADFYLGDEGKVIRDDEEKFLDRNKMVFFVAQEKVIVS